MCQAVLMECYGSFHQTLCSSETGAEMTASDPERLIQSVLRVSWHLSMPTPPNNVLFRLEAAQLTIGDILCLMFWSRLLPKRRAAICLLILHVPSVYIELIANLQVL